MKTSGLEFISGSIILAFLASWCLAVDEDGYSVLYLKGGVPQIEGKLSFTEDEIVFESADGKAMGSWSYSDVKLVDLKKPRLFKLKLAWGETFSFSPIEGERHFDRTLGSLLREKNQKAKVKM